MLKRELKRNVNRYGKLFEPVIILFLIIVLVLPIFAVINLSPQTGQQAESQEDVLGITSSPTEMIELVGGTHQYITDEKLFEENEYLYRYQTTLLRRDPGLYSKPVLMIKNSTDQDMTLFFTLTKSESSSTQIGLMNENVNYVIKASDGEFFLREFELSPSEEIVLKLDVRNSKIQNFNETIEFKIDLITPSPSVLEDVPVDTEIDEDTQTDGKVEEGQTEGEIEDSEVLGVEDGFIPEEKIEVESEEVDLPGIEEVE